ncbi:MAG: DUF6263 family protein [Bacteroidota bacterium]
MKIYISALSIFLLCTNIYTVASAQQLILNKGDEYKITTMLSSSMAMKRGDKQIDLTSMSSVTKSYQVTEASDNSYKLSITMNHIADTVNAFNQKLAYSSNRAADPNSAIETALSKMIGETHTVSLDKTGKITQVADAAKATANIQVAAISGLYNKALTVGNTLNFGAGFKLPTGAKKGTTWTETQTKGEAITNTTFTVEASTTTATSISFKSESRQPGINTNLNGLLVMDNTTGVILQRVVKTNSLSNEIVGDKTYAASRKSIISEICYKVK